MVWKDFPHHVFREYDIRGVADDEISEQLAYALGKVFMTLLPEGETRPVIVGRDVRLSGPHLQAALIKGLRESGLDVLDLGVVPTPLAYYATYHLEAAGCIEVTASHNPGADNGFKMMVGRNSLHGEILQTLKNQIIMLADEPSETEKSNRTGHYQTIDVTHDYITFVQQDCPLRRPLRVVIDAGNGPAGVIAAPLYRAMGCEVTELFCEPNGHFPNHHPDPTVEENMKDLATTVMKRNADLGIAFDGDGDRIGVVNHQGKIIWGDMLLLLLAKELLTHHPGATIISEIKSSMHMYDGIRAAGGNAIMGETGHSPIKAKMRATGALLAGEMSGHIFFADRYFGFDDATYAGARILQLLAAQDEPLANLLNDVPFSIITPEIRIACPDAIKFQRVEEAKNYFSAAGYTMIIIDGMRLEFEDGWALLRASNTQAALVMRFEAPCQNRLNEMRALIEGWLEQQRNEDASPL
ncbi:MAG: phosphomannomutase/phosphoglucomutase [Zetaproteobacteria bacterium]|nr:phosphomannomutase/phosphoglucomutase [Zetaproteobacteria bacterium]